MGKTIKVDLRDRSYDVSVGAELLEQLGEAVAAIGDADRAVVITDTNVAELYGRQAVASLQRSGLKGESITFPAGEENKTLATFGRIMDDLLTIAPPVDRRTIVVALGGGVVGDVAGFVAACALRGLRWLLCPTTLLADVDASVGGKTAVDHPAGKNLIGAFHQPRGVLIDVHTLRTLPQEELKSGLAECVKHGVIRDAALLDFLDAHAAEIARCEADILTELIARNVSIKAAVVAADERESGERAHLNFGHTVGHAIEAFVGFGRITHGQGVALGMVAEDHLALQRGLIDEAVARRVEEVLTRLGLATRRKALDADAIWRIMQHDKKARGGQVRVVLPVRPGEVRLFSDITREEVVCSVAALGGP
jgi:3-dehydroquinate synthase